MNISTDHFHYFRIFNINCDDPDGERIFEQYPTELIIIVKEDIRRLDEESLKEFLSFQLAEDSPFGHFTFYGFDAEEISRTQYSKLKGDERYSGMTIKTLDDRITKYTNEPYSKEEYLEESFDWMLTDLVHAQTDILEDFFRVAFADEPDIASKLLNKLEQNIDPILNEATAQVKFAMKYINFRETKGETKVKILDTA